MTDPSGRIEVQGPAAEETVRVFRAVVASVGSRLGMTIDRLDEWKIVADEAATMLIRAGATGTLTLTVDPEDGLVRTTVRADAVEAAPWPGDRTSSWPWRVIRQLATGAACRDGDDGPEISFGLSLSVPT